MVEEKGRKLYLNNKKKFKKSKNAVSEINNTLEGISSSLDEAEDRRQGRIKHPGRATKRK